jgi:hypothetical protein
VQDPGTPFADRPPPLPRRRPQFTIQTLLVITALCSVLSAAAAGLMEQSPSGIFLALAGPMALAIGLGAAAKAARAVRRWRQRREQRDPDQPPPLLGN